MAPSRPGGNREAMARLAAAIEHQVLDGVRQTARTLVEAASIRSGSAPGAPVATGELRGSVRLTIGSRSSERPQRRAFYPIVGAAEVDRATAPLKLGDVLFFTWIARHALIIDGGRRKDRRGRSIGSLQAPSGYVRPAMAETISRMRRWRAGARGGASR